MPLTPVLRWQKQADLCEFKSTLDCIASSRPVRDTQPDSVSKKKQNMGREERSEDSTESGVSLTFPWVLGFNSSHDVFYGKGPLSIVPSH